MSQMKLFENNNPDLNEKGIHPMDQILEEFSLENSGRDIYDQIRRLLPGIMRGHARVNALCTLLLVNKKLIFRTQFSEIFINCKTEKPISARFYLTDILEVLKKDRSKVLSFKILPGNLKINNRTISCSTDLLKKSEIKALVKEGPIALDLDYSKTDLFNLSEHKNKVYYLEYGGKRILDDEMIRDSEKIESLMKKYNIYRYEIIELLKSKMKNPDS
jgi:hypothetical protein